VIPSGGYPEGIATGPDGALWFTESIGNRIGRITTPAITPTSTPTAPTVPTFSFSMLGLLALSLAIAGLLLIRRS
jgi:hypothetical protein